jgi:glycosyltransferase involved in cell wall biosynthesis
MTPKPRISVIVPCYNHRRFLPERIESILKQTRTDFELILLDDASPDGSGDYLEQVASQTGARFLRNDRNTGSPFVQWNRGIQEAQGEFLWIAESDDVADHRFLERMMSVLEQHPAIGLASCRSNRIDEDGKVLAAASSDDVIDSTNCDRDLQLSGHAMLADHMYMSNWIISASAVVFRRDVYLKAGLASSELSITGDWLQWCRMLALCDFAFLSESLSSSRIHQRTRRRDTATNGTLELESFVVREFIRSVVSVEPAEIRRAATRTYRSWLQALRAGRYSGSWTRHFVFLWRLWRTDHGAFLRFLIQFPYAFGVWLIRF